MFTKQVTDSKAYQWFNERLEIQALADDISSKYVPPMSTSSIVLVALP
jgi:cytochrome b6